MRFFIPAILAASFPAVHQQVPAPASGSYEFTVEQGWSLLADTEDDFPHLSPGSLSKGIAPLYVNRAARSPFPPVRGRSGSVRARHHPFSPLKLEGVLTVSDKGTCSPAYSRIEGSDALKKYAIEFTTEKVRTFHLGGVDRWTGTPAEWDARLDKLEQSFIAAYLQAVTPQKPAARDGRVGMDPNQQEIGRRLFITTSLEEQLAVLYLARLHKVELDGKTWPASCGKYPDRSADFARSTLDRIRAQCGGTLAPAPARPGRPLKDQSLKGDELTIPSWEWPRQKPWSDEQLARIEESRKRLRSLAEETVLRGGIDEAGWKKAVEGEVEDLKKLFKVDFADRAAGVDKALTPKLMASGSGLYNYQEKDGVVEARAATIDMEVVFFNSTLCSWRSCFVQFESRYKATVKKR